MPNCRFATCVLLCVAFMLSSSYVRAIAQFDHAHPGHADRSMEVNRPPCHEATDGAASEGGKHHRRCCSDFACCVGLVANAAMAHHVGDRPVPRQNVVLPMRSKALEPLNPPPKPF